MKYRLLSKRHSQRTAIEKSARWSRRLATFNLCETLEQRVFLSLAPASIAGDVLVAFGTGGTGQGVPPSALRIAAASSGNGITIEDTISSTSGPGTYTYAATGASTATAVLTDSSGVFTVLLTFNNAQTGTYAESDSQGTSSGIFALHVPPFVTLAPASAGGDTITFNVSAGDGNFASSGTYSILPSATDNTYTLQAISGSTTNSHGTYVYTMTHEQGANIAFTDSTNFAGTVHMTFFTTTTGLFYIDDTASSFNDFQVGTFSLAVAGPAATTTAVVSDTNPAIVGSTVTLTATVTPNTAGGNTATGNVTFKDGATSLGTVALDNAGHAALATASLGYGPHSITAVYAGDSNFNGSTSNPLTQAIVQTHANNIILVNAIYEQLLGRPAEDTASGLQYWTGRLDNGDPLSDVADGIGTSTEFFTDEVTSIYHTYLHRAPDQTGLTAWVGQLQAGTINFETIRGFILGSQEFYNNMINQYGDYLTGLYQTLLGRDPDATGIAAWTPAGGAAAWAPPAPDSVRDVAAVGISTSFEQYLDFVGTNFNLLLNRNPSPPTAAALPSAQFVTTDNPNGIPPPTDPVTQGEQGFWADVLNHGLTDGELKADIIASAEWIHDQGL